MQRKPCLTTVTAILLSASTVALAQQSTSATASASGKVTTSSPDYSKSMEELQRAAQRLRESIQSLAQQPAGPKRDEAMKLAREALWETQQSMIRLPPELRSAPAVRASGGVAPKYEQSLKELTKASDRLYGAIHAMAKQPAGERRNQAMQEAREALFESEQAMLTVIGTSNTAVGATSDTTSGKGAGGAGKAQKGADKKADATVSLPVIVMFPPATNVDNNFSKGCWARLYSDDNFRGESLTISGPGDFAYLRTSYANFLRKWDSIAVGPKASLLAYDNPNYTQPVATFKPGQRVKDLDDKLGLFENIRAVRISCGK